MILRANQTWYCREILQPRAAVSGSSVQIFRRRRECSEACLWLERLVVFFKRCLQGLRGSEECGGFLVKHAEPVLRNVMEIQWRAFANDSKYKRSVFRDKQVAGQLAIPPPHGRETLKGRDFCCCPSILRYAYPSGRKLLTQSNLQ